MKAGELQNITGEINAIFPNAAEPGGTHFLRAPYHSQRIQSLRFAGLGFIQFNNSSGTATTNPNTTGDYRSLDFSLKEGITSGTYPVPSNEVPGLAYTEMAYVGGSYFAQNLTILSATLELEVSADGCHLTSRRFDITAKTHKDVVLTIKADFDIYLAIE